MLELLWGRGICEGWHLVKDTVSVPAVVSHGVPTMTLLPFLVDQRVAAFEILLDEGILNLRDSLFQLPFIIHIFKIQKETLCLSRG